MSLTRSISLSHHFVAMLCSANLLSSLPLVSVALCCEIASYGPYCCGDIATCEPYSRLELVLRLVRRLFYRDVVVSCVLSKAARCERAPVERECLVFAQSLRSNVYYNPPLQRCKVRISFRFHPPQLFCHGARMR